MKLPDYPRLNANPEQCDRLLSADWVRQSAGLIYERSKAGDGLISLDETKLGIVVNDVIALANKRYPDGSIPIHGRWRHLSYRGCSMLVEFGAQEHLEHLKNKTDKSELLGFLTELIFVSVLLDAGAGASWSFKLKDGDRVGRSEGLAIAALNMLSLGYFSNNGKSSPWRVDAQALTRLKAEDLEAAFQISPENPLIGVQGRVQILNRLGQLIIERKDLFPNQRLGDFFIELSRRKNDAPTFLHLILKTFGPMWPGRPLFNGVALGDVWYHPTLEKKSTIFSLVAFHKLSQWLTYSLIESFNMVGIEIEGVHKLTGLAEYRNGGLFFDAGVFNPSYLDWSSRNWLPYDEFTLEWRGLTVHLLDKVARMVQEKLGKSEKELPLANVLEGGTWALGREYAKARRQDGSPPFKIESDGTLF